MITGTSTTSMNCTKKSLTTLSRYCNCRNSTVFSTKNTTCTITGNVNNLVQELDAQATTCKTRTSTTLSEHCNCGNLHSFLLFETQMRLSSQQRACHHLVQELQLRNSTGSTVWTITQVLHNTGKTPKRRPAQQGHRPPRQKAHAAKNAASPAPHPDHRPPLPRSMPEELVTRLVHDELSRCLHPRTSTSSDEPSATVPSNVFGSRGSWW